jgi:hypothetical protein
MDENPNRGWNLFARVLQEVLAAHGAGLGHLDDRVKIHPEKVRRLQRSLKMPKSFPVLNIEEMEQVFAVFRLHRQERMRLRAALLATSIEQTLMDRINQYDALRAAEQILPIIEQALQTYADEPLGIGAVKGEGSAMPEEGEIERELGGALAAIDRATLALHLSLNVESHAERGERAREAREGFESALLLLETVEPAFKAQEAWRVWYDEAERGQRTAKQRLADLGA